MGIKSQRINSVKTSGLLPPSFLQYEVRKVRQKGIPDLFAIQFGSIYLS
jgi:hypothetical protein